MSAATEPAKTIPTDAATYTARDTSRGARRPTASETDPMRSWPRARPARVAVRVSWTRDSVVPSSSTMRGNAER
ncbi:Uncharacterised protein [Mycobacteroides abscessus]|nr:Uncharacterised protein [Mycobacteroides abscessus]